MTTKRHQLAADAINGVYECNHADKNPEQVYIDDDFYFRLEDDFEGVMYGEVTNGMRQLIEEEYGIH